MSRKTAREALIAALCRELPALAPHQIIELARKLSRLGATLQRLAEAQCNGDWPADNGVRETRECPQCGNHWVPESFRGGAIPHRVCLDCHTEGKVRKLLEPYGLVPRFEGDPRGPVLRLFKAEVSEGDKESGRERGIYVA